MNTAELTDQVIRLMNRIEDLERNEKNLGEVMKGLEARVAKYESIQERPAALSPKVTLLNSEQAEELFWVCTPVQHAVIQLILAGFSNQEIADRLDTSLASIKTRFRHLCGRLSIKGRADLETNYKPIFDDADTETYKTQSRLIKSWAKTYGKLTFKQAKKSDPYHKDICETNYRGITMI